MDAALADHLTDETILALVQASLPEPQRDSAELHLSNCEDCGAYLAAVARALTTAAEVPSREKAVAETRSMGPGAPASPRRVLPRGAAVGRYTVLGLRGVGAMGVVYAAYDPQLDRKVALKLLHHRARSDDASGPSDRLLQEARVMARLSHPNVVTVFDAGLWNDEVFVALEYVEGRTLRAWLADGRRHWREVLDVFLLAGEGLAFAHRAGVVHRDFKPENVLIGMDGSVRVTDFGLAGIVQAGAVATSAVLYTAAVGTPRYVAPEQKAGTAVEERADQFSFCVALHEALTGTLPQLADLAERGPDLKLAAPPEGPVPSGILRVLRRGLEADPKARYPTSTELLHALRRVRRSRVRWLAGGAIAAAVAIGVWGMERESRRRSVVACAAGIEEVWSAASRQRVGQGFSATTVPDAAEAFAVVSRRCDAFVADWARERRAACVPSSNGDQPLGALRLQCLDRQLERFRATVESFKSADPATVHEARFAAAALPRPEDCRDTKQLAGEEALRPRWGQDAVKRTVQLLAKARAVADVGRVPEALKLARDAARIAKEAELSTLEGEALLEAAELSGFLGEPDFVTGYVDAAAVALASGNHHVEARALAALVHVLAKERSVEEAELWNRMAEAAVARSGAEQDRAALLDSQGVVLIARGDATHRLEYYEQAVDSLRRSTAILAGLYGEDSPLMASSWRRLGFGLYSSGHLEEGLQLVRKAHRIARTDFGPRATETLIGLGWLIALETDLGHYEEALAHSSEILAANDEAFGAERPPALEDEQAHSVILKHLGRYDEAISRLERLRPSVEKVLGPDSKDLASVLFHLGDAHRRKGDPRRGLPLLMEALRLAAAADARRSLLDRDPVLASSIRLAIAQSKHALGARPAEWRPLADQAVRELAAFGGVGLRPLEAAKKWLQSTEQRAR